MKKVWAILIILALAAALAWVGLAKKTQKPQTIKTQVEGTTVTTEEDLNKGLMTTEDDGGTADFVELERSAEGL